MVWSDVYKVVNKGYGQYGIYYVETNRTVNFTMYHYEGIAIGVAKRMFRRDMEKIEKMLTSCGDDTTS